MVYIQLRSLNYQENGIILYQKIYNKIDWNLHLISFSYVYRILLLSSLHVANHLHQLIKYSALLKNRKKNIFLQFFLLHCHEINSQENTRVHKIPDVANDENLLKELKLDNN